MYKIIQVKPNNLSKSYFTRLSDNKFIRRKRY